MAFSDYLLRKKLTSLNSSQQSVETLAEWLCFHRSRAQEVVNGWKQVFDEVTSPLRRLTMLYVCNDVLQRSRRRGNDFAVAFARVLPDALQIAYRGELGPHEATNKAILRILSIWEERAIFATDYVAKLRQQALHPETSSSAALGPAQKRSKVTPSFHAESSSATSTAGAITTRAQLKRKRELQHEQQMQSDILSIFTGNTASASGLAMVPETDSEAGSDADAHFSTPKPPALQMTDPLAKTLLQLERASMMDSLAEVQVATAVSPELLERVKQMSKLQREQAPAEEKKHVQDAIERLASFRWRLNKQIKRRTSLLSLLAERIVIEEKHLAMAQTKLQTVNSQLTDLRGVPLPLGPRSPRSPSPSGSPRSPHSPRPPSPVPAATAAAVSSSGIPSRVRVSSGPAVVIATGHGTGTVAVTGTVGAPVPVGIPPKESPTLASSASSVAVARAHGSPESAGSGSSGRRGLVRSPPLPPALSGDWITSAGLPRQFPSRGGDNFRQVNLLAPVPQVASLPHPTTASGRTPPKGNVPSPT